MRAAVDMTSKEGGAPAGNHVARLKSSERANELGGSLRSEWRARNSERAIRGRGTNWATNDSVVTAWEAYKRTALSGGALVARIW
eukprot:9479313-Pyramimonas_sp.AAC.1